MEPKNEPASPDSPDIGLGGLNRALLDSALDCIITMDASGRVTEFNAAAQRLFGYSPEERIGQHLLSLILPRLFHQHHRILNRRRLEEQKEHDAKVRLPKDGAIPDLATN